MTKSEAQRLLEWRMSPRVVRLVVDRATPVALESPAHGPAHWRQVMENAARLHQLAVLGKKPDLLVLLYFGLFHDALRENEFEDPEHGARASRLVVSLYDDLVRGWQMTEEQLVMVADACRSHADGMVSDDPTIGACWDADRLDLPRVGVTVDPSMLSTDAGLRMHFERGGRGQTQVVDPGAAGQGGRATW